MRIIEISDNFSCNIHGKLVTAEELNDLWRKILTECSEIVAIYKSFPENSPGGSFGDLKILFSGRNKEEAWFEGQSRNDRKPLDSPIGFHNLLNKVFDSCGMTANRSNSFFVTPNPAVAYGYGCPYAIFPKNGFQYTWTDFKDLASFHASGILSPLVLDYRRATPDDAEEIFRQIVTTICPRNTDIHDAINMHHEIMIHGAYYAIHTSLMRQIIELMNTNIV